MTLTMSAENEFKLRKIVIAGGGTAGWMAAAALSKTLGELVDIKLIESEQIGTVGVGEATIPPIITFHRMLDIPENEFMRETQATFKLGISFENWRVDGEKYIHSFGTTGKDHWTSGFQHFWLNGLKRGHKTSYDDYCLELKAALDNKFSHLPNEGMSYAFHLDSSRYAKFLRRFSEKNGVERVEGKINKVNLNGETGFISSLDIDDGTTLEGDIFIDCTGFRGLLIGEALGIEFEDWTDHLPCNGAIAVQTESTQPAVPYTRSIAHEAGWQWRIPLQHRTGNGIVYCNDFLDENGALDKLLQTVEGKTITDPNFIKFRAGTRKKQWHKNCIAVGLSSGFMEPLETTSIHLIQRNILRFIRMMPYNEISQRDIDEFNNQADWDMETIRDFLVLHYIANERDDPFWKMCADINLTDSLNQKIELFRETGRVFRQNEELFAENSWIQVMMGQGIMPVSHHPIASKMTDQELNTFLKTIREGVEKTVKGLPMHHDYVKQYCGVKETA